MKGYYTSYGYKGYNPNTNKYETFCTEEEYEEFYEEL